MIFCGEAKNEKVVRITEVNPEPPIAHSRKENHPATYRDWRQSLRM